MRIIVVTDREAGQRLDKLLGKQLTICIGKKIVKHVVAQSYGTDYKIAVDSE